MAVRKRSLSPTAIDSRGFHGYIGPLKRIWGALTHPSQTAVSHGPAGEIKPFTASLDKRRRLSNNHSTTEAAKPRSSSTYVEVPSKYETYISKLQQEVQDLDGTIQRRATLVPEEVSENELPIPDIMAVRRQSQAMVADLQRQAVGIDDPPIQVDDANQDYDEYDFSSIYTDEHGNIVRPPFINLAPKERYQLLQLKRAVEASKDLETKLKHTINPNETQSTVVGNKVETATQTYDIHYLRNKLHFSDYLARNPNQQKSHTGTVFSGEFLYDVEEKPAETPSSNHEKYSGYLGGITKPKFVGDDSKKRSYDNDKVTLDSDYLTKTEKVSDVIKVKLATSHDKHIEPSTGFKFTLNKEDMDDLIKSRADNLATSEMPPEIGFGKVPKEPVAESNGNKRGFSFGKEEPKVTLDKEEAPKFTFTKEEPKFTFNKEEAPKVTFGKEEQPKVTFDKEEAPNFTFNKEEPPNFTFGKEEAPKFTFGNKSEPQVLDNNDKTTPFIFGTTPQTSKSNTLFSFGNKPDTGKNIQNTEPKPLFSFSNETRNANKTDLPKFNFGQKQGPVIDNESKEEDEESGRKRRQVANTGVSSITPQMPKNDQPLFNFGQVEKPSFNFGTTEQPSFNFGNITKPQFNFSPSTIQPTSVAANFSMGQNNGFHNSPGLNVMNGGLNGNMGANGFVNGITPTKPNQGFAMKENTPFSFSRSNTGTPESTGMGGQMGLQAMGPQLGPQPNGFMNMANRPNRKIAQMRRRRG